MKVDIDTLECGYLIAAIVGRARGGDMVARGLYGKLKAAAIALGVDWHYGDPWEEEGTQ